MSSTISARAAYWQDRFNEFTASGLSVHCWCVRQGVPEHRFYYWRRKFSKDLAPNPAVAPVSAPIDWLPVEIDEQRDSSASSLSSTISLWIGDVNIDVAPGFDAAHLRAVVTTLRGI